jgi:hypothetical protein
VPKLLGFCWDFGAERDEQLNSSLFFDAVVESFLGSEKGE